MKDYVIKVDENDKIISAEKIEDVKNVIRKLEQELNEKMLEKQFEDLSFKKILSDIADEIEKKTGKRPVFEPWTKNKSGSIDRLLNLDKPIEDDGKIVIKWDLPL